MIHGDVLCLSTWFSNICYKLVCLLTNRRYIIPLCLEEVILNIFWLGISAFILFKNVLLNYCMFNNTEQRTIPCLVKWVKNCFTNVTPLNSCVCVCVCVGFFFLYISPPSEPSIYTGHIRCRYNPSDRSVRMLFRANQSQIINY